MNVLLVEDELMARRRLENILAENFPELSIIGETDSVRGTLEWLQANSARTDIIFMDVELSDGNCFEIFRQTDIKAKVIMTTAYDNYAVKAFEVNSVDYLLKPIELPALQRAVRRCENSSAEFDIRKIVSALESHAPSSGNYKERFLVRVGERIVPVSSDSIACFVSENKGTYLVTTDGTRYIMNPSLDELAESLDPSAFFRVSRSAIVAKSAIHSVNRLPGSKLSITSVLPENIEVSRARVDDFLVWLEK